jgi:hypothetical protein
VLDRYLEVGQGLFEHVNQFIEGGIVNTKMTVHGR